MTASDIPPSSFMDGSQEFSVIGGGMKRFVDPSKGFSSNEDIAEIIVGNPLFHKTETITLVLNLSNAKWVSVFSIAGAIMRTQKGFNPLNIDDKHLIQAGPRERVIVPTKLRLRQDLFQTSLGDLRATDIVSALDWTLRSVLCNHNLLTENIIVSAIILLPKQYPMLRPYDKSEFRFHKAMNEKLVVRFMEGLRGTGLPKNTLQVVSEFAVGETYDS